jgi:RNA polymerase sigma-70 factor, ECF subfamily
LRKITRVIRIAPMGSATESELIRRCRRGDTGAWNELFDRHYAATGRFVFQLAHDFTREDAEEICQEVFLSVIKNIHAFQGNCQLQTWIFRIASNKARDYRQRRQAAKRGGGQTTISLQSDPLEAGPKLDPPSAEAGPDAVLISAERMALLQAALAQLGGPCREIIELRYFGDLSYEELSDALELNPKTVSSRLSKCLDRLETIARTVFSGAKVAATPSKH